MIVALPAEVAGGLVHRLRHVAEVRGHVMFEALPTDVLEQLLQLWYFGHACAAEGFERIVGKAASASVTPDHAAPVVSGIPREAHSAGLDDALASPVGI